MSVVVRRGVNSGAGLSRWWLHATMLERMTEPIKPDLKIDCATTFGSSDGMILYTLIDSSVMLSLHFWILRKSHFTASRSFALRPLMTFPSPELGPYTWHSQNVIVCLIPKRSGLFCDDRARFSMESHTCVRQRGWPDSSKQPPGRAHVPCIQAIWYMQITDGHVGTNEPDESALCLSHDRASGHVPTIRIRRFEPHFSTFGKIPSACDILQLRHH